MINQMITFRSAGSIFFGSNTLDRIGEMIDQMEAKRILVITDKGLVRCGLLERLQRLLPKGASTVYDKIEETPSLETIRQATVFAKKEDPDLLIGFGGGSPMDATKAVSVMMTNEGDISHYLGRDTVKVPGLRKILIPTTAGTGSEVTIFSVLAQREKDLQAITGIADRFLLPEIVIVDPTLTLGMPSPLTAYTGMDALSHAAESYLNIRSNFMTEPLALNSIKLVTENIEKATFQGSNGQARYSMSAGSLLAGMSLSQTGGGLAHALAETIQIPYKLAHGAAVSVILPHVMAFNLKANPLKYANIAKAMGVDSEGLSEMSLAKRSVDRVREIIKRVNLPQRLSDLGIPEKDLKMIAKRTMELAPSLLKVNPRKASKKDLLDILIKAY